MSRWELDPWDIPTVYTLDERGYRGAPADSDVFVLVKEYISSADLRQNPMLVLPASKAYPLTTEGPQR